MTFLLSLMIKILLAVKTKQVCMYGILPTIVFVVNISWSYSPAQVVANSKSRVVTS